jgi:cellulose synthase/poly-beta-1,6-N-acetylglucosamine synthase-like glycosyltransferase
MTLLELDLSALFVLSVIVIWFMIAYQFVLTVFGYVYFLRALCEQRIVDERTFDMPSCAILIPAHNEEKVIDATISAMLALDYPRDRLKIIVINQEGYKIKYIPYAVTYEQEPQEWRVWIKQRMRWVRGNNYVVGKFFRHIPSFKSKRLAFDLLYTLALYYVFFVAIVISDLLFIVSAAKLVSITLPARIRLSGSWPSSSLSPNWRLPSPMTRKIR